jgi:hypothetical protein
MNLISLWNVEIAVWKRRKVMLNKSLKWSRQEELHPSIDESSIIGTGAVRNGRKVFETRGVGPVLVAKYYGCREQCSRAARMSNATDTEGKRVQRVTREWAKKVSFYVTAIGLKFHR